MGRIHWRLDINCWVTSAPHSIPYVSGAKSLSSPAFPSAPFKARPRAAWLKVAKVAIQQNVSEYCLYLTYFELGCASIAQEFCSHPPVLSADLFSKMRFCLVVTGMCAFASFGALATPAMSHESPARLGRFSLGNSPQARNRQVDAKDIYVRALMKRRPTPRST